MIQRILVAAGCDKDSMRGQRSYLRAVRADAVDLFMIARQRQQHCCGIFCRRTCQLDCNLAAGEHHVNDLLGGFAVSYVDGKSPPICSRVFATLLSLVGIFPVLQCPAASLLPNPQSRGTA